jgi:hypothetical protein
MVEDEVVILGSYKPDNWRRIVRVMDMCKSRGMTVLSPKGRNLVQFPLADNPDFYYLEVDLELAGLTKNDLIGKRTLDITSVLDFRQLQSKICDMFQTRPLVHAVINNGKIGKSVACELAMARINDCPIIFSEQPKFISTEVPLEIRNLLSGAPADKTIILGMAEEILLRPKFDVYQRPKKEWKKLIY